MNKGIFIVSGCVLLLTGCLSTPHYAPPPLTDKYIADLNDAALCSLSNTQVDPRIGAEIQLRKLDCDPLSLTCSAKGLKKGTKKFSQCKADQRAQYALEAQKRANPAFGYCIDSGFQIGSGPMATCMAAFNQEQHTQFMFERQQESYRDQMDWQAAQERRVRSQESIQRNNEILLNSGRNRQSGSISSGLKVTDPVVTNCEHNGYGNIRCTTQ